MRFKKYQLLIILVVFSLQGCTFYSFITKYRASKKEYVYHKKGLSVIPFLYKKGVILVEIIIDGKKKYFILDSGARTSIDEKILHKFNYTHLGKTKVKGSTNTKRKVKNIQIDSIKIGNFSFRKIVASVLNFDHLSEIACVEISGIIGYNILKKTVWDIDFLNEKITISDKLEKNNKEISYMFYFDDVETTKPLLNFSIENQTPQKALLDLGYTGSISLPFNYFYKLKKLENIKNNQSVMYGIFKNLNEQSKIAETKEIKINGKSILEPVKISFNKSRKTIIIGTDFLDNYLVTYNGVYNTLCLSSYFSNKKHKKKTYGISIGLSDSVLKVLSITDKSLAHKSGIRLNDIIMEINEVNFKEFSIKMYCFYLSNNDINDLNSVKIKIKRENKIIDFNLKP